MYGMAVYPEREPFTNKIAVIVLGTNVVGRQKSAWLIGELRNFSRISTAFTASLAFETGFTGNYEMAFCKNADNRGIFIADVQFRQCTGALWRGKAVVPLERFPFCNF
jgi:hypothetical protein